MNRKPSPAPTIAVETITSSPVCRRYGICKSWQSSYCRSPMPPAQNHRRQIRSAESPGRSDHRLGLPRCQDHNDVVSQQNVEQPQLRHHIFKEWDHQSCVAGGVFAGKVQGEGDTQRNDPDLRNTSNELLTLWCLYAPLCDNHQQSQ